MIVDLLPVARSIRQIAGAVGVRLDVARREAAPFLALMRLNGTHPICGCGRLRFHPYGCVDNHVQSPDCLPGHTAEQTAGLLEKRAKAIELLVAGLRYRHIDNLLGMSHGNARGYTRFLTPDQLKLREEAIAARPAAERERDARLREAARLGGAAYRRKLEGRRTARPPHRAKLHPAAVAGTDRTLKNVVGDHA